MATSGAQRRSCATSCRLCSRTARVLWRHDHRAEQRAGQLPQTWNCSRLAVEIFERVNPWRELLLKTLVFHLLTVNCWVIHLFHEYNSCFIAATMLLDIFAIR